MTLGVFERSKFFFNLPRFIYESIEAVSLPLLSLYKNLTTTIHSGKVRNRFKRLQKGKISPGEPPWPAAPHPPLPISESKRDKGTLGERGGGTAEEGAGQGLGKCREGCWRDEKRSRQIIGGERTERGRAGKDAGVRLPYFLFWKRY